MPTIRYVNDQGEIVEEEVLSRRVTFFEGSPDDELTVDNTGFGTFRNATITEESAGEFKPAVVQRLEYDHKGKMSSITTVCGETENRRESDEKPRIVVEGLLVEDQLDQLQQIQQVDELTLISDLYQGQVEVKRVTVEQTSDTVEYIPNSGEAALAFPFQLQLRQP